MKFFATLCLCALAIAAYWYLHRPISYPPGALVTAEPGQVMLPENTPAFAYGAFRLKPLAVFSLDARILHRRNYRYDRAAPLVPMDLALGWGPMSDQRVIDQLNISQSMRFYWFEYKTPPIPVPEIITHSSNVHVIPATPAIASRCQSLRIGSLVHLEGDLVEASGPGIASWRSSLRRDDTGNGACELFYLENISEISADIGTAKARLAQH